MRCFKQFSKLAAFYYGHWKRKKCRSKSELEAKLSFARLIALAGGCNGAGARIPGTGSAGEQTETRQPPVRVIGNIEHLSPELKIDFLGELRIFRY